MNEMDLYELRPGDRVKTIEGSTAEILKETQDGRWILVRYTDSPSNPDLVGTEDLCSEDDLTAVLTA
jgi:hypothetical protein